MEWIEAFLWLLLAFVIGAVVAWLAAVVLIKNKSEEEAVADMPGFRKTGDR